MTLEFPSGDHWAIINSKVASHLKHVDFSNLNFEKFMNTLKGQHIFLYGADCIFYFPENEKVEILNLNYNEDIRPLTQDDSVCFSTFESLSTEEDLDGAFVELDHWKVFGILEREKSALNISIT